MEKVTKRSPSPLPRIQGMFRTAPMPIQPPPTPPVDPPDEALVERVLAGRRPIFELLMRRNSARLYRAIAPSSTHEDAVEELMQQTHVLAFSRLSQFGGGAHASPPGCSASGSMRRCSDCVARGSGRWSRWRCCKRSRSWVQETPDRRHSWPVRSCCASWRAWWTNCLPSTGRSSSSGSSAALHRRGGRPPRAHPEAVKQRLSRARSALRSALEQRTGAALSELYPFEAPAATGGERRAARAGRPTLKGLAGRFRGASPGRSAVQAPTSSGRSAGQRNPARI